MTGLKSISYKTKLISIYISTTLLGIILTLISIYNASHEQLILDHINNTHSLVSERIINFDIDSETTKNLAKKLNSRSYPTFFLSQLSNRNIVVDNCKITVSPTILEKQRMNSRGGIIHGDSCNISWVMLNNIDINAAPIVVFRHFDEKQISSIITAYRHRIFIPVIFFIWITVWGALMLGNLINRLQLQKEEVEHIALHDSLTGLPNRKHFNEKALELISLSKRENIPFTLAMIDLNKFKKVNDVLGHQYGDLLLKKFAVRLKQNIREYDAAARLGGDEFMLLLRGKDIESSLMILNRIYKSIIEEYTLNNHNITIGASIGVSRFPEDDTGYTELVHKADLAMYLAKDAGGGIIQFTPSMLQK